MKRNRIVVFNRLTDNELEEVSMFENLVGDHYNKFCFVYDIISEHSIIKNIDDISCKISDGGLKFNIDFHSKINKKIKEFILDRLCNDIRIEYSINERQMILSIKNI
jgi:hypothetical protein